jgi:hypothetical protein
VRGGGEMRPVLDVSLLVRALIIKAIIKFSNPKSARKNTWHDNLIMAVSEQKSNLGLPESDVPPHRCSALLRARIKRAKLFLFAAVCKLILLTQSAVAEKLSQCFYSVMHAGALT